MGDGMKVLLGELRGDGSIHVSKALMFAVGLDAAVVYCELVSRWGYFGDRGKLSEGGWFYNTVEDLERGTSLTKYQQGKAINRLRGRGLIEMEVRGVPPRRYFKILEDVQVLIDVLMEGARRMRYGEEYGKVLLEDSRMLRIV